MDIYISKILIMIGLMMAFLILGIIITVILHFSHRTIYKHDDVSESLLAHLSLISILYVMVAFTTSMILSEYIAYGTL